MQRVNSGDFYIEKLRKNILGDIIDIKLKHAALFFFKHFIKIILGNSLVAL